MILYVNFVSKCDVLLLNMVLKLLIDEHPFCDKNLLHLLTVKILYAQCFLVLIVKSFYHKVLIIYSHFIIHVIKPQDRLCFAFL